MTDSVATTRPASDVALGGWTPSGGPATAHAALSDDSDTTYCGAASAAGGTLRVKTGVVTLASTDLLRYARPWVKAAAPSGTQVVAVRLYSTGVHQVTPEQTVTLTVTPTRYDLLPYQGWPTGRPFTAADLAALYLAFRESSDPAGVLRVYEAGIDVVYNGAPTVVITAPGDLVTASSLVDVEWDYSDPELDVQGGYQRRFYLRPPGGWPASGAGAEAEIAALDAAGVQAVSDVTEIGDLTFSAAVLLDPVGTFRAYLRATDEGSGGRYGSWVSQEFTTAVARVPAAPTVVAVPDAASARVRLDLTPGDGAIDFYELQRSADAGATWQTVLGARPTVPYVPGGANVLNGAALTLDADGDGLADSLALYSTPGGDAAPTPSLSAGVSGSGGQHLSWAANTGRKGVAMRPRVATDGSNAWRATSEWLLAFQWKGDAQPGIDCSVGGFTVAWLSDPAVSASYQLYSAIVTAPGADTVADVVVYSDAATGEVDLSQPQLVSIPLIAGGGMGVPPMGAEPLGGPSGPAVVTDPFTVPQWRAREDTPSVVYDRTAPRGGQLLYRARQVAKEGSGVDFGSVQKASAWATAAPVVLASDGNAWLHSSSDGGLDAPFCHLDLAWPLTATEAQQTYYAEGRPDAVVVGSTVRLANPDVVTLGLTSDADLARFSALRGLREPLLLQTVYGESPLQQLWVRVGADVHTAALSGSVAGTGRQYRDASFAAWQVAEPDV